MRETTTKPDRAAMMAILSIGHDVSMRGIGKSLAQALLDTHYADLRPGLTAEGLTPLITQNPDLINQWVMYSADKRTSGGWYLLEDGVIGEVESGHKHRFESMPRAVAEYVLRELDVWLAVGETRRTSRERNRPH